MNKPDVRHIAQLSDEWKRLHIGRPTASNFDKILTPSGAKSTQRKAYMCRLIAEKLLGEHLPLRPSPEDRETQSYWIDRGIAMEPIAIRQFEQVLKVQYDPVGFVISADGRLGCSPDGLVRGKNEAIEIKSPAPWTHMKYLLASQDDPESAWANYRPQVQGQILIGQFNCIHFFSFHPRMPNRHHVTEPLEPYQTTLRQALADFVGELDENLKKAQELGPYKTAEDIFGLADGGS